MDCTTLSDQIENINYRTEFYNIDAIELVCHLPNILVARDMFMETTTLMRDRLGLYEDNPSDDRKGIDQMLIELGGLMEDFWAANEPISIQLVEREDDDYYESSEEYEEYEESDAEE